MSTYLVTGVAGFIASKVCEQLLAEGHTVVGVDNLNDYYDVRLKDYRLSRLLRAKGEEQRAKGEGLSAKSEEQSAGGVMLGTDPKVSIYRPKGEGHGAKGGLPLPLTASRFAFYHLDIENLPALEALFAAHKFDAVFNLGARAGVRYSLEFPELYRRTNVLGEENVLKCQVKYGVKKHVLASSSSVYAGCPMPFTEDAKLGKMQSPYAETKWQAENLAHDYHRRHRLDVSVLRFFTVFGPAGRPDMAPFRFIKWIDEGTPITLYGDGTQSRDFTYVDDIARGTILAGKLFGGQMTDDGGQIPGMKPETGKLKAEGSEPPGVGSSAFSFQPSACSGVLQPAYDIINLGGGRNPISLHTVIGWIEKFLTEARSSENPQVSGLKFQVSAAIDSQPPSAADMKETWADISKAERLLGWKPRVTPEDGFRMTVEWHVQNRDWIRTINVG
jgi:nucleoside-diphosphate-sugar epimerase